jgi:dephospho-CoA kinase
MKDKKIFIGITGEMGSGKNSLSYLLEKHFRAEVFVSSQFLMRALRIFLDEISRNDLIWFVKKLTAKYGNDIISKTIFRAMRHSEKKITVFNGVRLASDYSILRKEKGILVYVTADSKLRWKRTLEREEKSDDGASYKAFMKMHQAETEKYIPQLGAKADYVLNNDGTLEELEKKMLKLFEPILGKK